LSTIDENQKVADLIAAVIEGAIDVPSSDLEAMRLRYIPQVGEVVTEEEFIQRGVDLVATARNSFTLIGELIGYKFAVEGADTEQGRNAIVGRYAPQWGVSPSTIWKAWVVSSAGIDLLPEDAPPTLTYEIVSGCANAPEAEQVLDLALERGYTVNDVREVKALRAQGLIEDWNKLRLVHNGNGTIYVDDGQTREPIATLLADTDLARAGVALLRMRARV